MTLTLHFLLLLVLVSASAFFSGTEVALFSLRRVDRERLSQQKHTRDRLILQMVSQPRRLIATILIGNECVNVAVGVVMAGLVPRLFTDSSELELGLIATVLALPLLLLCGEITPKSVAMKTSMGWARRAAMPLWLFAVVVAPIRGVVSVVADVLMLPFGGHTFSKVPSELSEEEFKTLVDAGMADGEIDMRERRLIQRVFEFGDKRVGQIMLPRKKIFALSYDLPASRLVEEIARGGYSRVPIYQKSLDSIRGIVYAKDLVVQAAGLSSPRKLSELLHEPLFVPHTVPIERLFRLFKQRKVHVALVVNEYGRVVGIVTMEDLLEELFGEISDERETQKARAKGRGVRLTTEPVMRIVPEDVEDAS